MAHKKEIIKWFLYHDPEDKVAFKVLSKILTEKAFKKEIPCVGGRRRDMWETPRELTDEYQHPVVGRRSNTRICLLNLTVYEMRASDGLAQIRAMRKKRSEDILNEHPAPGPKKRRPK